MKIIKNKQIIEDRWQHLADDEVIGQGQITVSLNRWQQNRSELSQYSDRLGIRIAPEESLEAVAEDLQLFPLIAVEFPVFTDGRGFSHIRLLRDRYHYSGEIRAIGHYMPDQVFYLSRVGADALELQNPEDLTLALSMLNDFSVSYQ